MADEDPLAALSAAAAKRGGRPTGPAIHPVHGVTYGRPLAASTSGLAVAALILSIVPGTIIGGILSVCLGTSALHRIRRSRGMKTGRGLAIAGIIIGIVDIVASFVVAALFIWLVAMAPAAKRAGPAMLSTKPAVSAPEPPGALFRDTPAQNGTPQKPADQPPPDPQ